MNYEKIEKLRKLRKLTQLELSKLARITEGAYQKIASGRSDAKVSTIEKISKALGVEVGYFFSTQSNYTIIEDAAPDYSNNCKECKKKDEIINLQFDTINTLKKNNEAIIKTNDNLNKCIEIIKEKNGKLT